MVKLNCPPGKIERVGYHRRGYFRKSYYRKNGEYVHGSYVSEADVSPKCVKDMGKPGKGPKTLPPLGNKLHLRNYGYAIHKPEKERHQALIAASNDNSTLEVLRRLNLIRNYQAIPEIKKIFSKDVDFMKSLYAKRKKEHFRGGKNDRENYYEKQTFCDEDGDCHTVYRIYELHKVNNRQVLYYTLDKNDKNDILSLNNKYISIEQTDKEIIKDLKDNPELFIGIRVNGVLEGYFQYDIISSSTIKIIQFCANKGYGTPLMYFMDKFFNSIDYHRLIIEINMLEKNADKLIEFWKSKEFHEYNHFNKNLCLEKNISND